MLILFPYYLILGLISMIWAQIPFWLLKIKKPENVFFDILFGIIFLSIISMLFVIGGPINLLTQGIFLFSTAAIAYLQREEFKNRIQLFISTFKQFSKIEILVLIALIIPILYQSAQATKINDNGGYYQPTIAWMEQFGLVKGLANIYPALGLFSSWHSLTALFDLNQLGLGSYHQINGFLLSWFLLWIFREWKLNLNGVLKLALIGMLVYVLVFGFFFLSAPNADLPMICFSGLLIFQLLKQNETYHPLIWWMICIGLFIIKPPASTGLVLAFIVLFDKKFSFKSKLNSLIIITPILFILIFKNVMLSGYVLYPMNQPDLLKVEWKVPKNWNELYRQGIVSWGIQDKYEIKDWDTKKEKKGNRLSKWLFRSGYKGLMNKILFINWVLALVLIGIGFIRKLKINKIQISFFIALLFFQVFEWLYLSQYRLMLATGLSIFVLNLFYLLSLLNKISEKMNQLKVLQIGTFTVAMYLWAIAFIPFSAFSNSSRNKSITNSEGFNNRYLIEPWHQFDNGPIYTNRFNNMVFYYYPERVYCWDCPLPCVSKSHHDFLLKNLGLEITPIGKNINEGFKLVQKKEEMQPK